jgi:hypothetical protein
MRRLLAFPFSYEFDLFGQGTSRSSPNFYVAEGPNNRLIHRNTTTSSPYKRQIGLVLEFGFGQSGARWYVSFFTGEHDD